MDASGNLLPLNGVWGGGGVAGEATQSLNDLRHLIFGNTKEHTK